LPTAEDLENNGKNELLTVTHTPEWMLRPAIPNDIEGDDRFDKIYSKQPPLAADAIEQAKYDDVREDEEDEDDDENSGAAGKRKKRKNKQEDDDEIKLLTASRAALRNQATAERSVHGLTHQQMGLLAQVLILIMSEPSKAIQEDKLWSKLNEIDPEMFRLGNTRDDAREMEKAVATMATATAAEEAASSSSSSSAAKASAGGGYDRSLYNWRELISKELTRMEILTRRQAISEKLIDEEDLAAMQGKGGSAATAKTELAGDPKQAYRIGPKARQLVTAAGILSMMEAVTGTYLEEKDFGPGILRTELTGFDQLLDQHEGVQGALAAKGFIVLAKRNKELGVGRPQGDAQDDDEDGSGGAGRKNGKGGKSSAASSSSSRGSANGKGAGGARKR
jgi:hypothetical protein